MKCTNSLVEGEVKHEIAQGICDKFKFWYSYGNGSDKTCLSFFGILVAFMRELEKCMNLGDRERMD